jgi:dethiobiotin synthetase
VNYFVTGIDTDSGKTLTAAILCEALKADYWKPIQAGAPSDSDVVRTLISNSESVVHNEAYRLRMAASPHASAKAEGISIVMSGLIPPITSRDLVIEGAGGCLVPINDHDFIIDLAAHFDALIVLTADLYLGSINHTLLSVNELRRRNLPVKGIIFNGQANPESERIILKHSTLPCLLRIDSEASINREIVKSYANRLLENWNG